MKVLWITNVLLPPICKAMNVSCSFGGGWLYSSAKSLLENNNDLELAVASIYKGDELKKQQIDNVIYYLIPLKGSNLKYQKQLEPIWKNMYSDFKPDIVHLHGTEYAHGLSFIKACPDARTIVSIQGLVSVIARYYQAGISNKELFKSLPIRSLFKRDTIWELQKQFEIRGKIEEDIIRNVDYVIGRTSWDKSHTLAINPNLHYFYCGETLRDSFYTHEWSYDKCEPYSIFVSQAGYPIKGLHQVLKAMPFVLTKYPDAKIYVAGNNIINNNTLSKKIRESHYAKYIRVLIDKLSLHGRVVFTESLNEKQICDRYLKSNVFVNASSIENSPNSLAEALIMGVPSLSSYVGGAVDMMKGNEAYLYRYEEYEMLAQKICYLFKFSDKIYQNTAVVAEMFDKTNNKSSLLKIYEEVYRK